MNADLLNIINQITAQYGEDILNDARRLKSLFGDLAKDEPKPLRMAFCRCAENGFYPVAKNTKTPEERREVIDVFARRLRDEEGLDLGVCTEALELFAAALFGEGAVTPASATASAQPDDKTPQKAREPGGAAAESECPKPPAGEAIAQAAQAQLEKLLQKAKKLPVTASPPGDAKAWFNQGNAHQLNSEYIQAVKAYSEALRLNPNYAESYIERAKACRYAGRGPNFELSIVDYTEALRINPNNAEAYSERANKYRMIHDLDRAIADYTEALRIDPHNQYTYLGRGIAYYDQENYDLAIADFEAALAITPNDTTYTNWIKSAQKAKAKKEKNRER